MILTVSPPGSAALSAPSLSWFRALVRTAERGGLDAILFDGQWGPTPAFNLDPIPLIVALAECSTRIGLAGAIETDHAEPFNIARSFAAADRLTAGRSALIATTGAVRPGDFGHAPKRTDSERYARAAECIAVARKLWDSWEDDAFVADKARGVFADTSKLHSLNHKGEFFQVRGPLNIGRSPQGQPVIFQAGASGHGRDFAARRAEAVFSGGATSTVAAMKDYYADIKMRAAALGRDAARICVLPEMSPVIGRDAAEAEANFQQLVALGSLESGLGSLSRTFSDHDFTQYDLDGPFPELTNVVLNSTAERFYARARQEKLSIRRLAQELATPRSEFVGTPDQVADRIQAWFDGGVADGFMLFETLPGQLDLFIDLVVPILQARGIFRTDYEGATLRENLGLDVPPNRHAIARTNAVSA